MPMQQYRKLKPVGEAEHAYLRRLDKLDEAFALHPQADRREEIVRDELGIAVAYRVCAGRSHRPLAR